MGSSSESTALDIAYLVAAMVEEAGGELSVSTEWFEMEKSPFLGRRLELKESDGLIYITLTD